MTRILTDISFIKNQVSASTPPSGFGTVYASGSDLYFRNDAGTIHNLTSNVIAREYIVDSTWTRPAGIKEILVICVGAGGGGGSGRRGGNSTSRSGGGGGGGGAIVWASFPSSSLTNASYAIVIGAGGNGGVARTTDANGAPGSVGSDTSFGALVIADGGAGGPGGGAAGGTGAVPGGLASACTPLRGPFALTGADATTPSVGTTNGANGFSGIAACPSGGTGGGATGGNVLSAGGNGGGIFNTASVVISGPTGGAINGGAITAASSSVNKRLDFGDVDLTYGIGTAGAGTGASTTANAATGGTGGSYGAGGGGGGAATGFNSGAGGAGAPGLCIVIEHY